MTSTSAIIGRFLGGAAAVAVPAALEDQKIRAQQLRDETQQRYQLENETKRQAFVKGENEADRGLTRRQLELQGEAAAGTREYQQQSLKQQGAESAANSTYRQQMLANSTKQLEMEGISHDLIQRLNQSKLDDADTIRAALEDVNDPALTPEQRAAAVEHVRFLRGDKDDDWIMQQKKQTDKLGNTVFLDEYVAFNTRTSETIEVGATGNPAAPGGAPPKITTQAEYAKLPKGTRYTAPDGSIRTKT